MSFVDFRKKSSLILGAAFSVGVITQSVNFASAYGGYSNTATQQHSNTGNNGVNSVVKNVAIGCLCVATVVLLVYVYDLKKQMADINRKLEENQKELERNQMSIVEKDREIGEKKQKIGILIDNLEKEKNDKAAELSRVKQEVRKKTSDIELLKELNRVFGSEKRDLLRENVKLKKEVEETRRLVNSLLDAKENEHNDNNIIEKVKDNDDFNLINNVNEEDDKMMDDEEFDVEKLIEKLKSKIEECIKKDINKKVSDMKQGYVSEKVSANRLVYRAIILLNGLTGNSDIKKLQPDWNKIREHKKLLADVAMCLLRDSFNLLEKVEKNDVEERDVSKLKGDVESLMSELYAAEDIDEKDRAYLQDVLGKLTKSLKNINLSYGFNCYELVVMEHVEVTNEDGTVTGYDVQRNASYENDGNVIVSKEDFLVVNNDVLRLPNV